MTRLVLLHLLGDVGREEAGAILLGDGVGRRHAATFSRRRSFERKGEWLGSLEEERVWEVVFARPRVEEGGGGGGPDIIGGLTIFRLSTAIPVKPSTEISIACCLDVLVTWTL